jgi:2-amino-4-hydroxy-6-hydroxymethyldihydropteridine diphosphokinase
VVAYVAVGSNIQPEANIPAALDRLLRAVRVAASSTFYRTPPLVCHGHVPLRARADDATGSQQQTAAARATHPDFLNGVWLVETGLAARVLKFDVLRRIEEELGRKRLADKYAPRTIDLDLIVYGDAAIAEPDLRVPDPDIRSRAFVALPLLELSPELVLADTGERLAELPVALSRPQLRADREITDLLRERIGR